jgi:ATP-dependent RNA helicase RhlE
MLFSATMPPPIEQLAQAVLRDPTRLVIAPPKQTLDLIEQSVMHVPQTGKQQLLESLLADLPDSRTIVFTRTKHGADRVVKHLDRAGFDAAAIHGNKSQNARQRALDAFKRGHLPVLVATDLAARGIDVDDVTHVINFDLPHEPETYVHRVGRTGRAGASGIAISFCSAEERGNLRDIERLTRQRLPSTRGAVNVEQNTVESHSAKPRHSVPRPHQRRATATRR